MTTLRDDRRPDLRKRACGRRSAPGRRAVVSVLVRVGQMAERLPEVAELDLNPLVLGGDGGVVVDARLRVARPATADPALRALTG